MVDSEHYHHPIDPDGFTVEAFIAIFRQGHYGQFQVVVGNCHAGILGIHELQIEVDLRVANLEIPQGLREPVQADVMTGGKAEVTAGSRLLLAQSRAKTLQFLQDAFGVRLERRAIGGEDAALANAIEQRNIHAGFELANAFTDRGLGDVQPLGSERKRLEFGDGQEGIDLIELHGIFQLFQKGIEIMKIMN